MLYFWGLLFALVFKLLVTRAEYLSHDFLIFLFRFFKVVYYLRVIVSAEAHRVPLIVGGIPTVFDLGACLSYWLTPPFMIYSLRTVSPVAAEKRSTLQVYSLKCRFLLGLGGDYFFRFAPNVIAARTSMSNAMVSCMLIGVHPFSMYRWSCSPPSLDWLYNSIRSTYPSITNFKFVKFAQFTACMIVRNVYFVCVSPICFFTR